MSIIDTQFKEKVITTFKAMKFEFEKQPDKLMIPIYQHGNVIARLHPVHARLSSHEVKFLTEWRNQNRKSFFTWITATEEGTKKWLTEQILHREDRILFIIETLDGIPFGHIGLTNFDFSSKSCEINNVLRGKPECIKIGMSAALQTLINWAFLELDVRTLFLRVFADNQRAVDFYRRNGLRIVKCVPLQRIDGGDVIQWVEAKDKHGSFEKWVLYMEIEREEYGANQRH